MVLSITNRLSIFAVFVTVVFQLQDLKVFDIKLTEMMLLGIGSILLLYKSKTPKFLITIFLFFLVFLIVSLLTNINRDFYINGLELSFLKVPYVLSISRFIEFLACIFFINASYIGAMSLIKKGVSIDYILKKILRYNYYFALLFISFFFITKIGIDNLFYYSTVDTPDRLKGFYVEGGPLGLFYGFLFGLNLLLAKPSRTFFITFIIIILLAQSKAGILMAVIFLMIKTYSKWKRYIPKAVLIVVVAVSAVAVTAFVLNDYLNSLLTFSQGIDKTRLEDSNYVMGRISGMYITPHMIIDNPLLGVGMGNYSLMRNNPAYLGEFPPVYDWDLQGLGGIVSLLTEGGIIGLLIFFLIIYRGIVKFNLSDEKKILILCLFFLPMILGVQLYFPYQWFVLGLAIIYAKISTVSKI